MDKKKALLQLFALLFCLSYLLSLDAAPLSRSLALSNQGASEVMTKERPIEKEGFVKGRMDLEFNDYPGSGANNRHDPRSPGKP